jgi:hypothetical protein
MRTASVVPKSIAITTLLLLAGAGHAWAAQRLKPFVLAYTTNGGSISKTAANVEKKLKANGFSIVGSYRPYTNAKFSGGETVSADVIGVTNNALGQAAAATKFGGYAIVQRVTVTKVVTNGSTQIQVAYTNPPYMANAYRLKSNLTSVASALKTALGAERTYGSKRGLTVSDLRHYHYKFLMPYFTDAHVLHRYHSYQQAVSAVEAGLAAHKGGTTQVWEVAVPGKQETLFGVGLSGPAGNSCSGDRHIMSRIDFQNPKSTGHLPYEMVVAGKKVYALGAKFRIAINFPDLSMMGSNSFLSIMCAPGSIEKALKAAARG